MQIRKANHDDLDSIARVYIAGHPVAYQADEDRPYIERMQVEPEIEAFKVDLANKRGLFLVATDDEQIVAFAFGGLADQPNTAGLAELWVHPERHGGRPSKLLMRQFVVDMNARGAVRMVGYVAKHNLRAAGFMAKTKARKIPSPDMRIFNHVADLPERRVPFDGWQWDDLAGLVRCLDTLIERSKP